VKSYTCGAACSHTSTPVGCIIFSAYDTKPRKPTQKPFVEGFLLNPTVGVLQKTHLRVLFQGEIKSLLETHPETFFLCSVGILANLR